MTPAEAIPERFDVHLFAVVRVKVSNIEAASPRAAIDLAREQVPDLYNRFEAPDGEFAEEFAEFLVDVVGVSDYRQSRRFHSIENPLLAILANLVAWHTADSQNVARLDEIVADAKEALNNSA